ncbi:MAG: hypothetical protein AB7N24_09060 [Dehalococcoidia bacterium]
MARKVPRKFSLHFGSGSVAEEATFEGEHHQPTIQLLDFDEGEAAGSVMLRFCSYNHRGQFMREPLILADEDMAKLRESIRNSPRIAELLRKLLD